MQLCLCDGAWLHKADALEATTVLLSFLPSFPPFFHPPSYLTSQQVPPLALLPFLPSLPSQQSDHPSTLPPTPARLSFSFALMSLSLALVGCRSQTSRSNLSILLTLPPSAFLFFSLHWLYISCALSLLSNFCLRVWPNVFFFPSFPPLVSVKRMEMIVIVFSYIVLEIFFRR